MDPHADFKEQIKFFVKKITLGKRRTEEMQARVDSCAHTHMFENLLELIEDPSQHEKMPVRKFFNNTFGTLLNDACFTMLKKI